MCRVFRKTPFVRKVFQLKTFISLACCASFEFVIYNLFKRNNIRRDEEDINGKCVVVTGGSSGIGKSSAREFAQRGATVVIGDVDLENGQKVVKEIQQKTGNKNVTILKLDLSDMDSVEEFSKRVAAEHPKIKILLNNAGIGGSKNKNIITNDGFNIHMAVNYMGHFLLTNLLMKNLQAEEHSRIVSTTSTFMLMQELDLDDINMEKSGFGLDNGLPYSNTKYCLALFTKELGKRVGVNSYAFCPGMVDTPITHSPDVAPGLRLFYRMTMSWLSVTADEAASEYVMFCALEKRIKGETGQVYRFRKHYRKVNKNLDADFAKRLWDKSSEMVRLNERLRRFNCT